MHDSCVTHVVDRCRQQCRVQAFALRSFSSSELNIPIVTYWIYFITPCHAQVLLAESHSMVCEWDAAAAPLHNPKDCLLEATVGTVVNTALVRWASGS